MRTTQSFSTHDVFEPITEVIPAIPSDPIPPRSHPFAPAVAWSPPGRRPGAPIWLRVTVAGLGVALAAGMVGLGLERARPSTFAALRARARPTGLPPVLVEHSPSQRGTGAVAAGPHVPATVTRSTMPALGSSAAGAPHLASLRPAGGGAGTIVTIAGSGFHSASGEILASFGGVAAATRCASASQCEATVPAGVSPGKVVVRVRTDSGNSNGLIFAAH